MILLWQENRKKLANPLGAQLFLRAMKNLIHISNTCTKAQAAARLLLCAAAACGASTLAQARKAAPAAKAYSVAAPSGDTGFSKAAQAPAQAASSGLGQPTALKMAQADESNSFQQGTASWYGPGFHNRLTANGERYNMNAMTAAHKTLPFGTMVLVKNVVTGKSVTVRINDRGPYVKGRIIDLSRAAAQQIGGPGSGLYRVALYRQGKSRTTAEPLALAESR